MRPRCASCLGAATLALYTLRLAAEPLELAPPTRALTLARVAQGSEVVVVLVGEADAEGIGAAPLGSPASGQALDALAGREQDEIALLAAPGAPLERYPWSALLPAISSSRNIAAGANYAAHGEEVSVEAPFVFPKLAAPDPSFHHLVADPDWLLDYEVEVAVVFDRDIHGDGDLAAAQAGLFTINDFTDRAALIREVDLSVPDVGGGFANAKGQPGFLPTGPFVVVPRDWRAFLREIEIRLDVNGVQRQQASAAALIWDVEEIARRALALQGQPLFVFEGAPVTLLDDGIPKGMAILTGTPGGVVFNAPGNGYIAQAIAGWIFGFHFLDQSATAHVQQRLIDESRIRRNYLQPGDRVVAEASWLGNITTRILPPQQ